MHVWNLTTWNVLVLLVSCSDIVVQLKFWLLNLNIGDFLVMGFELLVSDLNHRWWERCFELLLIFLGPLAIRSLRACRFLILTSLKALSRLSFIWQNSKLPWLSERENRSWSGLASHHVRWFAHQGLSHVSIFLQWLMGLSFMYAI